MPVYAGAKNIILENLSLLIKGGRAPLIAIGCFTNEQMNDVNAVRRGLNLHEIESSEIVYIGKHHFTSRSADGYTIEDMWHQIESALDARSVVTANRGMTSMQNPFARIDGYGNQVKDRAIFELTQRKPRAELFSAIPKGDRPPVNQAIAGQAASETQKGPPLG